MHNFKVVTDFLNKTYILAVFKGERSKVILFSKINRVLRSMTQGSIRLDLIKKCIIITQPDLNSVYPSPDTHPAAHSL